MANAPLRSGFAETSSRQSTPKAGPNRGALGDHQTNLLDSVSEK
jgi:hypothetical protein